MTVQRPQHLVLRLPVLVPHLVLQLEQLRDYLAGFPFPVDGWAVLEDALCRGHQGALNLVELCLAVRVNRRSRCRLREVRREYNCPLPKQLLWMHRFPDALLALWRMLCRLAVPFGNVVAPAFALARCSRCCRTCASHPTAAASRWSGWPHQGAVSEEATISFLVGYQQESCKY